MPVGSPVATAARTGSGTGRRTPRDRARSSGRQARATWRGPRPGSRAAAAARMDRRPVAGDGDGGRSPSFAGSTQPSLPSTVPIGRDRIVAPSPRLGERRLPIAPFADNSKIAMTFGASPRPRRAEAAAGREGTGPSRVDGGRSRSVGTPKNGCTGGIARRSTERARPMQLVALFAIILLFYLAIRLVSTAALRGSRAIATGPTASWRSSTAANTRAGACRTRRR